ncbi:MAG: glycosyltransferase family 2 protein, partial [Candidatus Binatia bacterium]
MNTTALRYSVVVPLYDEEENVEPLTEALVKVMDGLGGPYELLYVDDGSRDATLERARTLADLYPPLRVVALARNYGQTAALAAGFDHCRGEIIITLDGDLQNDPEDIPCLLRQLEEGYDLVVGWRQNRQEPFL